MSIDRENLDYRMEPEDRLQNEPLISFVDNDFVLSFLNDYDHPAKPKYISFFKKNIDFAHFLVVLNIYL